MKTWGHLWLYLAEFFLEWEIFQTAVLSSITFFFRKSYLLLDNAGKYGTARQATDGNITRRMRFAC
jgi:hypothetical protein